MTVPTEAYVSIAAVDATKAILKIQREGRASPEGEIVHVRTQGFLVVVAKGKVADQLARILSEAASSADLDADASRGPASI